MVKERYWSGLTRNTRKGRKEKLSNDVVGECFARQGCCE